MFENYIEYQFLIQIKKLGGIILKRLYRRLCLSKTIKSHPTPSGRRRFLSFVFGIFPGLIVSRALSAESIQKQAAEPLTALTSSDDLVVEIIKLSEYEEAIDGIIEKSGSYLKKKHSKDAFGGNEEMYKKAEKDRIAADEAYIKHIPKMKEYMRTRLKETLSKSFSIGELNEIRRFLSLPSIKKYNSLFKPFGKLSITSTFEYPAQTVKTLLERNYDAQVKNIKAVPSAKKNTK